MAVAPHIMPLSATAMSRPSYYGEAETHHGPTLHSPLFSPLIMIYRRRVWERFHRALFKLPESLLQCSPIMCM